MVGSVAGEVIASLGGVAICAPLLYQSQSVLSSSARSPLHVATWYLWTAGFLGLAVFFGHVPSNETHNNNDPNGPEYEPLSPRALGVVGIVACALCQLCCALDLAAGSRQRGRQRAIEVTKYLAPGVAVVLALYYAMGLVHSSVVLVEPFYLAALAVVAYICAGLSAVGSILAVHSQTPSQLRRGGSEVAGLYWMPAAMQALGYFTGVLACVLVYTNVEWLGVGLLGRLFGIDILYILASRLKSRKF